MKIKGGYFWKILSIDLDRSEVRNLEFDEDFALQYIGGRGFNARLLWDNLQQHNFKIDPFGPENIVAISPGPLCGVYMPASGKTSFATVSPATGIYGDSSMGGTFGPEFRQTGHDGLVIKGRAKQTSYIWIDGDNVQVVPAPHLKGRTNLETEGMIRKDTGDEDLKIATLGPAGEKGVVFACMNADWGRNAGRTGIGAVLGKKNIKAIAVRGSRDLPVADLDKLVEVSNRGFKELMSHDLFEFWQQQGLMSALDYVNTVGALPTNNFRDAYFDQADRINGFVMEEKYKIGDSACFACPMSCGNVCLVKGGEYSGTAVEGPEYETACIFGSNLGVSSFDFILKCNQVCDELGVDTISTGNLIGVMIEGYQSGILTREDTEGLELQWGDEETIMSLIHNIAKREGIGDTLAGGSYKVLERWPQLKPILSHVKGLEQSAYDARAAATMALGYGTSDIGAHHTRAWPIAHELEKGKDWPLEKKADLVIYHQTIRPLFDMLGVCRLPWIELGFPEKYYEEIYQAVTGVPFTLDDLLERSRSLYDLTRMIGIKLGVSRKDDYPPPRVFEQRILSGPHAGKCLSREVYEDLLDIYYKKRGWDKDGKPTAGSEDEFNRPLKST